MQFLSKIIIKYIKDVNIIKKLPKIYQNNIDKPIRNNRVAYYSNSFNKGNLENEMSSSDIDLVIDSIFNDVKQAFNIPVIIKTNTKVYDTFLIARTSNNLLTLDQDRINVGEIVSIKRKNP